MLAEYVDKREEVVRLTHEPPRSSPIGGMYTKMGCSNLTSASTMYDPYFSTSLYMSRCPPEKPRQLARIINGSCSPLLKSRIACAVLKALFGYHTPPASLVTCSIESGLAGSAGDTFSTERVSTAMTPMGMPPRRARPTTTVRAQPPRVSSNEFLSKRPDRKPSSVCWPAIKCLTS